MERPSRSRTTELAFRKTENDDREGAIGAVSMGEAVAFSLALSLVRFCHFSRGKRKWPGLTATWARVTLFLGKDG